MYRRLGGETTGKSFRFVCACDARLVYLMSDQKEILIVVVFPQSDLICRCSDGLVRHPVPICTFRPVVPRQFFLYFYGAR